MVSVQQVDSLLQAGAQFFGKASKTGKQCLLNTGDKIEKCPPIHAEINNILNR
jgi:hypothetical protein